MIIRKAIKVQLLPNNKQETRLFDYSGAARFAYNWALGKEMESLKNGRGFIPDGVLRKELTELKHADGYEWLSDIDVDVTKQAVKDLCSAFKRYLS
jgi:putative transposase